MGHTGGPEGSEARSGDLFVGRERELRQLQRVYDDAASGRGRLVMLVGEPGIGKTRTAEELAAYARGRGALVLWGPCHEGEGAPAYWPWVQILRQALRGADAGTEEEKAASHEIAKLIPELSEGKESRPVSEVHPEHARFLLFDAIGTFLKGAAERRPLVLILDDMHWADRPSLLIFQFLAREIHTTRIVLLGTYRHTDIGRQHPLTEALGELSRGEGVILRGLSEDDVGRFIEGMGHDPSAELVSQLYATTEGNPFFVAETMRLLASEGRLGDKVPGIAIPMGARMLIGRRLDRLSPDCNELLVVASVSGTSFASDVLERVSDLAGDRLFGVLDEAIAAGVIEEVPGALGRYRFAHALIRETLYEELSTARRIRIHRAIAEALEQMPAGGEMALADIARHFFESAKGGDIDKAIVYARRAGDRAAELLAYEDAVLHYQRALQVIELKEDPDERTRIELLLQLGAAQARAGEADRARESFFDASDLARRIGAAESLAAAALGFGGGLETSEVSGSVDETSVRLLQEALSALPNEDGALRARLLGRLAAASYWSAPFERRDELSSEAVEMARRLGDQGVLAASISNRRYALWTPEDIDERLHGAEEILRLAEEAGDKERVLQAHRWVLADVLEKGDIAAADREIEAHAKLAAELRQKIYIGYSSMFYAMRALWEGRFDEAGRLAREAETTGRSVGHMLASGLFFAQMFRILWDRGELGPLEDAMASMRSSLGQTGLLTTSSASGITATLAFALAEFGRTDQAKVIYERLCGDSIEDLPRGYHWLVAIGHLAGTCAVLGDTGRAGTFYELLLRFSDRILVGGPPVFTVFGPVAYFLGLLAATMGRTDDAARHLEDALTMTRAMNGRPMAARIQLELARVLAETDPDRAAATAAAALAEADQLGMRVIAERARELAGAKRTRMAAAASAATNAVFRREGEFWSLGFSGPIVRLKDQKGLGYIARLLRSPGREIPALDLAGSGLEAPGDAGEVLDAAARESYKRRLADLAEELEDAEQNNDEGRASKAREEIDVLTDQLASAVGLGGRARRASSVSERARVSVRNAIASSLKTIRAHDDGLWRHLSKAIRTGNLCCYDPETPVSWDL